MKFSNRSGRGSAKVGAGMKGKAEQADRHLNQKDQSAENEEASRHRREKDRHQEADREGTAHDGDPLRPVKKPFWA